MGYTYILVVLILIVMNIHPLFVHFPIGILVLYIAFEIFRIRLITKQPYYFELRAILVIIGTIAGYFAAFTGDMAEELKQITEPKLIPLIEIHAMYAMTTIVIFSLIAGAYLSQWLKKKRVLKIFTKINFLQKLAKTILKYAPVLAIIGLTTITITGGLGASIVYGSDVDPFVTFIYNLFTNF